MNIQQNASVSQKRRRLTIGGLMWFVLIAALVFHEFPINDLSLLLAFLPLTLFVLPFIVVGTLFVRMAVPEELDTQHNKWLRKIMMFGCIAWVLFCFMLAFMAFESW